MTNDEKIEILLHLKDRVDKARNDDLDLEKALELILSNRRVLEKLFYESEELRDLSLYFIAGLVSVEGIRKAME